MQSVRDITPNPNTTRPLERFLAVVGTVACLAISARIWYVLSGHQSMWPLPGLYLLEMTAASLISLWGILKSDSEHWRLAGALPWAAVGVFAAFIVMGAWSIGPLFLPVALIFVVAAFLADRRRRQNLAVHLVISIIAALVQVALILAVIRLLYP